MLAANAEDASAAIFIIWNLAISGDSQTFIFQWWNLPSPPQKNHLNSALKAMNWAEGPAQIFGALLAPFR